MMLPLRDYIRRGPYDEIWTPSAALDYLLPHLSKLGDVLIWEICPGSGALLDHLAAAGKQTTSFDHNTDGLLFTPRHWDAIVSNPPYSIKHKFLRRVAELKKPWALLLPVTTLGVKRCQTYLKDAEVIFLPKRIDFIGKKAPWFAVAWFTWGFEIGRQMTFMEE